MMTWTLSQTSRAALVAATIAVPFLALPDRVSAQTDAPSADATMQDTADSAAANGDGTTANGVDGTASEAPAADGSTADMTTTTGSGEYTGSAAQSGSSADMALTYQRVVADLQSGRDFRDQLDGIDPGTTITVKGLTELEQVGGGAVSMAEEGAPPMTGGQNTIDTNGSIAMQSDDTSGASAGGAVAAPAGIADGLATGSGTQTIAVTESRPGDIDTALAQGEDTLTKMRQSLTGQETVIRALEAEDYAVDDAIALHRGDDGLTVVVDDREN